MMNLNKFISEWLQAWTGNRPQVLLEFYAEDAFYSDPAYPDGIGGKANLTDYFTKLLARNPEWVWKAVEIFPTDKGCTLKWKAQIPTPKETVVVFGLDIVEIDNGLITRNEVYFDRMPWVAK